MKIVKLAILVVALSTMVFAYGAQAGGLNISFDRCDITDNFKPIDDYSKIKPGVKILAPLAKGRPMTAVSGVFLWAERDHRPTVKAVFNGAKSPMYVNAAEALYCAPAGK